MNPIDPLVSVAVPLHNDAAHLGPFVEELLEVLAGVTSLYEVILVDDGSADDTAAVALRLARERSGVRLIRLSRRFGADIATMAGLDSAVGDVVVVMRPDSDSPTEIPRLLKLAVSGVDLSVGVAANPPRTSALFRLGRAGFARACRTLGLEMPHTHCTMYGLSRRAVNAVTRVRQRPWHLSLTSCSIGFRRQTFTYRKHYRGTAKPRRLPTAVDLGLDFLLRQSRTPLRFVTVIGCTASVLNLVYVGYVFGVRLFKDHVAEGWTTLSLQNALMFLLVFLTLVLLAEYVGRIQDEASDRPLYHVLEEAGHSVVTADPRLRNVAAHAADTAPEARHVA
jgi:glycosyltransferase involved in cell wall biosynthesis